MAKLQTLKVDPELASKGVWFPYLQDIELKIARAGTVEYDKTIRELTRPAIQIYRSSLPQEVMDDITARAMARHCLVDWKNIDAESEPVPESAKIPEKVYRTIVGAETLFQEIVPYSENQAYEFLKDPSLYDLYRFVLSVSNDVSIFRSKRLKEALGN